VSERRSAEYDVWLVAEGSPGEVVDGWSNKPKGRCDSGVSVWMLLSVSETVKGGDGVSLSHLGMDIPWTSLHSHAPHSASFGNSYEGKISPRNIMAMEMKGRQG
jgi:hypothetical protein